MPSLDWQGPLTSSRSCRFPAGENPGLHTENRTSSNELKGPSGQASSYTSNLTFTFLMRAITNLSSVQFSHSVVSNSLWPHGLQHVRLPCPSPTFRACSNSCPSGGWCHPTILCHPFLLLPSIFPSIENFSNVSALRTRWPKCWSFSFNISPSNEYPGFISFRIDWFDLPAVQGTLKSSPATQFKSINSLALSLRYGPAFTSIHD